jgi:hypothetical protein
MKRLIGLIILTILIANKVSAQVTFQTPAASVQQWDLYELTIQDPAVYSNPFWDVTIQGQFSGPGSETINVRGFYYDAGLWKVRFSPDMLGTWSFNVTYSGQSGVNTFQGSFQCTTPSGKDRGFIQVNPNALHKFKYSDNTKFIPRGMGGHTPAVLAAALGIQPGTQQVPAMWDSLAKYYINTFRLDLFNQSAFYVPFPWNTNETHANFFAQSGGLDKYNTFVGKVMDRWFQQAQVHDISIYLCMLVTFDTPDYPFSTSVWSSSNGGPYTTHESMYQTTSGTGFELEKKYFTYILSRYAAYRNLVAWEYNNEYGYFSDVSWLAKMDSLVRANDPYGRARTVSFWDSRWSSQSPVDAQSSVTVTDDHFYSNVYSSTEFNGDSAANAQARVRFSMYQKPVMFGEFGSGQGEESDSWLTFQRIAYWGAFTGGGYPLFWLSGGNYLSGWQFNQHTVQLFGAVYKVLKRLNSFSTMHPGNNVTTSNSNTIRVFSLTNNNQAVVYIQNYTNHSSPTNGISIGVSFSVTGSMPYSGIWLNASTGDSVGIIEGQMTNETATFKVPSFNTDLLFLLTLNMNTGMKKEEIVPREFLLDQNFPNPFNPTTMINYSVPKTSFVTIKVYDVLGRDVTTLVNDNKPAGNYSIEFNAIKLVSGIYFYRMRAGDFIQTKKLILLK